MKRTLKLFALTALSLMLSIATFAQVTTSSMSGKVTEADGQPAVGATVLATHTPSGSQFYAIVDGSGNYRIPNMRAGGPYTITVNLLGFGENTVTGVELKLAENYVYNVKLTEEAMSLNELVVSADGARSSMRSERAGATTSLNMQQMNDIPVVSRNLNNFVKMTPQSSNTGNGPQIGGGTYRQNNFTIDGAAMNNAFGIGESMPAKGSPVSMDALEQISINVTPFDVRQTGFLGGAMNATTRSGDNTYRASVYTYYYNEKFRGEKMKNGTLNLNEEKNLVYGARVGGPIIKDKLFFFLSAEAEDVTSPGTSMVASDANHTYTNGKNGVARPSAATMDAISKYLSDKYGYNTGAYQGYSAKSPSFKFLGRLDWNINRNHKINVRYNITKKKTPSDPSTSTSGLADRKTLIGTRQKATALYYENARYYQETNYSSFAGELNSRFLNGALTNLLRVTYSHQDEPRSTEGGEFPFVDFGVGADKKYDYYTSFGTELFSYGNLRDVRTLNVTDELTYSTNKHFITFGLQYEHNKTKNGFQRFGAGYYSYTFESEAEIMNRINDGTLMDNPFQYAITHSWKSDFSQAYPEFKFNQVSIYLQDEISFTDNFKVQAGVRFEVPSYPKLNTYNAAVFKEQFKDYNNNNGHYDTSTLPQTSLMISPRIGFNWDLFGNRNVVVRGGTGLFTGRLPFVWIVAQAGDSGVLQNTYTVKGSGVPTFSPDRLDALKQIYPGGVSAAAASLPTQSFTIMADDLKMPQTWKSSLGVDFKLPLGLVGSVEGIYNYDVNPTTVEDVSLKEPTSSAIPDYADNRLIWGDKYKSLKTGRNLPSAYLLKNADKNGYYYSVTAKLEKPYWKGFYGMIAYTYSNGKSLNDGWGDQVYSAFQNAATVNGNNIQTLGYASYIMPHRLIANISYSKEYAKHFRTGISLFYEGGPQGKVSYTYTSNIVGDYGGQNLIYVPASKDELKFADYDWSWEDADGKHTETYTAAAQAEDFWNFINNNKYLKTRKGKYAERNGLVYPWVNQFDLKITQDFFIQSKNGMRNTLQIGLDIKNVGNLLNKNWGNMKSVTKNQILYQVNKRGAGKDTEPVYNFQRNGTEVLKDAFVNTFGTSSTYLMQISVRYMFN